MKICDINFIFELTFLISQGVQNIIDKKQIRTIIQISGIPEFYSTGIIKIKLVSRCQKLQNFFAILSLF